MDVGCFSPHSHREVFNKEHTVKHTHYNLYIKTISLIRGRARHGRDRMVVGDTTIVYSFLQVSWFRPHKKKTDLHDITELLLKVVLNTKC